MTCLPSSIKTEIQDRLAKNRITLEKAETALNNTLDAEVESYKFDSGEGSQSVKRRKLSDLQDLVERLRALIQRDESLLIGAGITTINLRRKNYVGFY